VTGSRSDLHVVAAVGIGQTQYSRHSGRSEWALAIEAIDAALADCGLGAADIDGLVRYSYDNVDEAMLCRSFGFQLRYYSQTGYGGLGAPSVLAHAYAAIASGQASAVVCYRALNGRSGTRYGRAERSLGADVEQLRARGDRAPSGAFAGPYGLLSPGQVMAMWARRYQWESGATESELIAALARLCVTQRAYAQRNPSAIMSGTPLDEAGYLAGRMIATPLRIYDLAVETDGAAAGVVTGAELAGRLAQPPVWISGSVQAMFAYAESISIYGELRNGPTYRAIGDRLLADCRLTPADFSAAMIYDATSISVLLGLEAFGFAAPGTAWRRLLEEGTDPGSSLPVNTSGGHLSEAYVHGINLVTEGIRQCRGHSTSQVARSGPVLVTSGPGAVVLEP
jgi:acetyl-CoA acetyltransferase